MGFFCTFFRPLLTLVSAAPSLPASHSTVCTSRFTWLRCCRRFEIPDEAEDRLRHKWSETGRIRSLRVRFRTPNSVSLLALTEFLKESSVRFLSAYYLCAKANSPSFRRTHWVLPQNSVSSPFRIRNTSARFLTIHCLPGRGVFFLLSFLLRFPWFLCACSALL